MKKHTTSKIFPGCHCTNCEKGRAKRRSYGPELGLRGPWELPKKIKTKRAEWNMKKIQKAGYSKSIEDSLDKHFSSPSGNTDE